MTWCHRCDHEAHEGSRCGAAWVRENFCVCSRSVELDAVDLALHTMRLNSPWWKGHHLAVLAGALGRTVPVLPSAGAARVNDGRHLVTEGKENR